MIEMALAKPEISDSVETRIVESYTHLLASDV